jgi:hypothetical protein
VIDDGVLVFRSQTFIRFQFVAKDCGTGFNMLSDHFLNGLLFTVGYDRGAYFPTTFNYTHDNRFVLAACSGNNPRALRRVHVPRFPADEGFVRFDFAGEFHEVPVRMA